MQSQSFVKRMRSPQLLLAVVAVSIATFYVASAARRLERPILTGPRGQSLKVVAESGADYPLTISSIVDNTVDPRSPVVEYTLTNVSRKPIRAYAIAYEETTGVSKSKGVVLNNIVSPDAVLMPARSERATLDGITSSEPVTVIKLLVDFVEFTDGSTWGADEFKSAEKLAGRRTGAQVAARRLLALLETEGPHAVLKAVSTDESGYTPPEGQTPVWLDGFRLGVKSVNVRVKRAHERGGLMEIEPALRRPSDASERR